MAEYCKHCKTLQDRLDEIAASRQSVSKALLDEIGNAAVVQQQIGQGEYEVGNVAKSEWHKGKAAGMREVLAIIVHSSNDGNQGQLPRKGTDE